MAQTIWRGHAAEEDILAWLRTHEISSVFLVHGHSATRLACFSFFQRLAAFGVRVQEFTSFSPNPLLVSAEQGAKACAAGKCDMIAAIGGGSAMDVAKVVKLLRKQNDGGTLPLLVVPTTAGTGSEATHFAVVYQNGVKQSVQDACILPELVWFLPENLLNLPRYQRQATALDAFCHAFESYWSVHATDESKVLSREALQGIQTYAEGYVNGEEEAGAEMMRMAHLAGQAIDHTQTTAGHAMCYELTHLAQIAHGHAAALCVDALGGLLLGYPAKRTVVDERGAAYLDGVLAELRPSWAWLHERLNAWAMRTIHVDLPMVQAVGQLVAAIHPTRLRNFPFQLSREDFAGLYQEILEGGHGRNRISEGA